MLRRSVAAQRADPFGLGGDIESLDLLAGCASAGAGAAAASSADSDMCTCGGEIHCDITGLRRTCDRCGLVTEGDPADADDDSMRPAPGAARLKLVGVGSGSLQPDLYRSGSGDGAAAQKRQVLEEFHAFRQQYIESGGVALPLDACTIATQMYNEVQRQCVKRSQSKRGIMAACYWRACLKLGLIVPDPVIASCMQLTNSGIAAGLNELRALEADGKLTADPDMDTWRYIRAEITTLFMHIELDGPEFAPAREAVFDIVRTATDKHIGTMSVPRSKVNGAAYSILRRVALSEHTALPADSHRRVAAAVAGGLQAFCGARIRKNTVERFLTELNDFHSHFEPVYERHRLDARPTIELKVAAPKKAKAAKAEAAKAKADDAKAEADAKADGAAAKPRGRGKKKTPD